MSTQGMTLDRQQIIAGILWERHEFSAAHGRYLVLCEFCGKQPASDAHEALIKRSAVQGNPVLTQAVTTEPCNIAMLCHACHMRFGQTDRGREVLVRKLIDRYRIGAIALWLLQLKALGMHNSLTFLLEANRIAELEGGDPLLQVT